MSMSKREREIRKAKIQSSRAYGKNIGEKKSMGHTVEGKDGWTARIAWRQTVSFRDFYEWRVDVYHNGNYMAHDLFWTIEEGEQYASDITK